VQLKTKDEAPIRCSHLLIAFPPSTPSYVEEVKRALTQWDGSGVAVLISSTGVFLENRGGLIDDQSALNRESLLFQAEMIALKAGAHVLRLGGLYSTNDGPHRYWQKQGQSDFHPEGFLNLIHRQDAAEVVARVLKSSLKPKTWIVTDGQPIKRTHIANSWAVITATRPCVFDPVSDDLGKRIESCEIFSALECTPRRKNFLDFVASLRSPRNVFGQPLKSCCRNPVTGFSRDGLCRTGADDFGEHTACADMTDAFLKFSKSAGNDLSTPRPEYGFRGLVSGDKWCLCASRWLEAWAQNCAPWLYLESCHLDFLDWTPMDELKKFALDLA
jgi:uncharacterized protein (DUF2237 family)